MGRGHPFHSTTETAVAVASPQKLAEYYVNHRPALQIAQRPFASIRGFTAIHNVMERRVSDFLEDVKIFVGERHSEQIRPA
jgi:hypothetical protein